MSPKVTCDYKVYRLDVIKKIMKTFSMWELKLVVRARDLPCAKELLAELGWPERVVLQPLSGEGDYRKASKELIEAVLKDKVLKKRVRVIPQVHKFVGVD